ncbi:MAG: hypothetical protein HQM04_19035 [Magnetococcales bacterium]|nr:hypothetical protein [Magnetococcales bacterium]MBF0117123.1 hypothetical protein [Magnetococcales bacterium]
MKAILKRLSIVSFLIFLVVAVSVGTASEQQKGKSEAEKTPPPLLGNIAGVKLAFPYNIKYSPYPRVHYEGRDKGWGFERMLFGKNGDPDQFVWRKPMEGGPVKEIFTPTYDSNIEQFSFMVRMSDFSRIKSERDFNEWLGRPRLYGDKNLPPDHHRWLDVEVRPDLFREGNGNLRVLFDKDLERMSKNLGQFSKQSDEFGLKKIASSREAGKLMLKGVGLFKDTFFYDDEKWETLIECMRNSGSVSGMELVCRHYFVVRSLNAVAEAYFHSVADLSNWKTIEMKISKFVESYIAPSIDSK